jgi:hypothetical protein
MPYFLVARCVVILSSYLTTAYESAKGFPQILSDDMCETDASIEKRLKKINSGRDRMTGRVEL